jgi:hypothetical protein
LRLGGEAAQLRLVAANGALGVGRGLLQALPGLGQASAGLGAFALRRLAKILDGGLRLLHARAHAGGIEAALELYLARVLGHGDGGLSVSGVLAHLVDCGGFEGADGVEGFAPVIGAELLAVEQVQEGRVVQAGGAAEADAPLGGEVVEQPPGQLVLGPDLDVVVAVVGRTKQAARLLAEVGGPGGRGQFPSRPSLTARL